MYWSAWASVAAPMLAVISTCSVPCLVLSPALYFVCPLSPQLVLVIGDFHIPHRAESLPEPFRDLLVPGKMQHVLCTGNVCSKATEEYLRTLASSVHIVKGDMDVTAGLQELPDSKIVSAAHTHQQQRGAVAQHSSTSPAAACTQASRDA